MSLPDRLLVMWLPFLDQEDVSLDETRQRLFVAVATFLAAPGLFVLAILEIQNEAWFMVGLLSSSCVILISGYVAARSDRYRSWMPKLMFAYLIAVMFSQVAYDRGQFTLYYFFIVPIISVFLFGRSEGLIWSFAIFAVVLPLTIFSAAFGVPSLTGAWADFVGTYLVIVGFSVGYETLRAQTFEKFQNRNRELELEHARVVQVQGRLKERESRFRSFTNLSSDWLLELDKDFIIEYASSEIEGRVYDGAVGTTADELVKALGAESVLLNRLKNGESISGEQLVVPFSPGVLAYYLVSAKPLFDDAGQLLGYIAGGKDITAAVERERELKIKEQALFHAQKLEALGQLTSGVTHDFNNLLTVIGSNLELIEPAAIQGGEHESLSAAMRAVDRAAELTEQLLSFSRKQNLEPNTVDVTAIFGAMIDMLTRTLGDTVAVKQEVTGEVWSCHVDPGQLESALLNLALNARDAMHGQGELCFKVENFSYSGDGRFAMQSGDYVAISVRDSGCGIDGDDLERIWEPFFTTKPMGKGTGLGLSMIYGFVMQSGGAIDVQSTLGVGSDFTLYLPRAVSVEVEGNTQQELESGPKLTIMVVEDDPGVQRIIDRVLRRDGHLVRIFGSAESALEALSSFVPEIIVSDIMLGSGMNGLQLAEQIRQSWPNQPLLLMSGNPESLMSEQDAESYPLIKKPFSSHDFLRSIRAVIQP